jgi:hypothetical protein
MKRSATEVRWRGKGDGARSERAVDDGPANQSAERIRNIKGRDVAVAASSGVAFPHFMTRICIGRTLAKQERPFKRRDEPDDETKPTTIRDDHRGRPQDK